MPFSTRKPWIAPSSVRAQTVATSAMVPFVIHILAPLRIQSEPSRARVRAHRARVGAGVRLGQTEAADRLAGVHRRQPALLLLLGAPLPDREHRQRALHRDGAADAGVARLELEAGEPVGDRARAGEAVAVEVHAEEAELAQLRHQLARQDPLLEPVADVRQHVLAHEGAHGVADRPLLVVEQGVDREEVERVERGLLLGHGQGARVPWPRARGDLPALTLLLSGSAEARSRR